MTDKEFKRLKRGDLISIIYEYQKKQDELLAEIDELKEKLSAKGKEAGSSDSVREVTAELSSLLETARKTADEYVGLARRTSEEAERKAESIITEAKQKAEAIAAGTIAAKN